MWKMLQQKQPNDYVIGTGKNFTIKGKFVNRAARKIGFKIKWIEKGINEKAIDIKNGRVLIECKRYFRPVEVDYLRGDAKKAKKILKWSPKISIDVLIDEMIEHELENLFL